MSNEVLARAQREVKDAEAAVDRANLDDTPFTAGLGLIMGETAATAGREAATLELHRKDLQTSIRDTLLQNAERRGEKLTKSAAEEQARSDADYVQHCTLIIELEAVRDRARALRDFFFTIARSNQESASV